MSIVKLIFLFQLLFTAICGCESRECVGDGIYVDFPREETRKAGERSDGRHCSDIPHNLKMFEDEDTPTSACNHKYCPSCILVLREYCLPLDDKNFCQPLRAQLKHEVCRIVGMNHVCDDADFPDGTEKICKAIGAHCDGLCGDVIKRIGNATVLIDERRATPYKICKAFNLC